MLAGTGRQDSFKDQMFGWTFNDIPKLKKIHKVVKTYLINPHKFFGINLTSLLDAKRLPKLGWPKMDLFTFDNKIVSSIELSTRYSQWKQ